MHSSLSRVLRWLGPLVGFAVLAIALTSARRQLAGVGWSDLVLQWSAVDPRQWALALVLTVASYVVLAGYEVLAVRFVGLELPTRKVLLAGALGWAVSNSVGPAWLSGGAVRMRLYRGWGVPTADVARIVAFDMLTFWLGFVALTGAALVVDPPGPLEPWGRGAGLAVLAVLGSLAWLGGWERRRVEVGRWSFVYPGARSLGLQLGLGLADNLTAIGALYVLLPRGTSLAFTELVSLFALSNLAGILSGLPGGAGTFDGVLVSLSAGEAAPTTVLGAVLGWRLLYTLLPLLVAGVVLAVLELRRAVPLAPLAARARRVLTATAAPALATLSFVSGLALLASAFTPADPSRLQWLADLEWLTLLETSRAASAVVGVGLLFVARGLWLRLREAWTALVVLLLLGALASVTRGLDWESATALAGVLLLAVSARGRFYRRAALAVEVLPPARAVAVAVSVAALAVLMSQVGADDPIASLGEASRALRTMALGLVMAPAAVLGSLLRPARVEPPAPSEADIADAVRIATAAGATTGWMAALGDKALLFDAERTTFLMCGAARGVWVSPFGPIGPAEAQADLLWSFRELAHRAGARVALYEVPRQLVPVCVDLGLQAYKFGEEAVVPLAGFTLQGGENSSRRQAIKRAERERCAFEVVPADAVPALLAELRAVSDAWLEDKGAREKGFSLGWFDEAWLARTPIAVVRRDGAIVAFANLLVAGPELSVDLMRFRPDAPNGTMDYLFLSLLRHGADQGFERFTLGMAPLAGLPDNALAPLWAKVGSFVFRRGESFYNFQGLRAYKEKFRPRWEPRYLAVQGGSDLPVALRAVTELVGGGRGVRGGQASRAPTPASFSTSDSSC